MRNAIKFFYNIEVAELLAQNDDYIFENYILKKIDRKIDYSIYNFFIKNNLYIDKIIYNRFNELESFIDNKWFILIKREKKINLSFFVVLNFFVKIKSNNNNNWSNLWKEKIDYYEKMSIKITNKEFRRVFPYYIGLSENAIKYYNEGKGNNTLCFSHNRINGVIDFYSPSNIIIDCIARDIAEYIKYSFFENKFYILEFKEAINSIYITRDDAIFLFSRLLFPTYFFDCIELDNNYEFYSCKINQYEKMLNDIFILLSGMYNIPRVEWIIKKI